MSLKNTDVRINNRLEDSGALEKIDIVQSPHVRKYYLTGVIVILLLVMLNYFVTIDLITHQDSSAILINTSGRQRMLSQRIALVSQLVVNNIEMGEYDKAEINQTELSDLIDEMVDKHNSLVQGRVDPSAYIRPSDKIMSMYQDQPFAISTKLEAYIQAASYIRDAIPGQSNIEEIKKLHMGYLLDSTVVLLNSLDAVVNQYDTEYADQLMQAKSIQTLLLIITIGAFILKIIFIFQPMEQKIIDRENALVKQIDIRHKIADDLYQAQYIYKLMVANLPNMAFIIFDKDKRYILAGGPFLEKSGYIKEDLEGKLLNEVIKDKSAFDLFNKYYDAALKGETTSFERKSIGGGLWYHTQIVPMVDHDGIITGGMVITEDIDERKKVDLQLIESDSRFRQLAENITTGFWLASADGNEVFYISPAMSRIYGQDENNLYQKPRSFISTIHPEDVHITQDNRIERIHGNKYDVEYRVIKGDGSIRWLWARAFPVKDNNGVIIRTAGIVEDITERKMLEEKAVQLGIEQQTIKLLSNFIRDTAHDLKTPLTIIRTSTHILEKIILSTSASSLPEIASEVATDENKKKHLGTINKQVDRLKILIEQLQNMSQLETAPNLKFSEVNISEMIHSVVKNYSHKAEEKDIEVSLTCSPTMPNIKGDANNLYRAISNVYENAIIYTNSGGSIDVIVTADTNDVMIKIKDTGIGIDKKHLHGIFQRFYKANEARTSNNSGSGLGLSMAKLIIDKHFGSIEVESEPNKGSVFKIRVPFN